MGVGTPTIGTLLSWNPTEGRTVSWEPTPAALAKARQAPISEVPVSRDQARHIRNCYERRPEGIDCSRLTIVSCEIPGLCDIRLANVAFNTHLRRHETYRSRFQCLENGQIIRRTMRDVEDVEFIPVRRGALMLDQLRHLINSTPDPLHWDCFRFGVVQGRRSFTLFASVDQVHAGEIACIAALLELSTTYTGLVRVAKPAASGECGLE